MNSTTITSPLFSPNPYGRENPKTDLEETREKVRRLIAQLPYENQPLNPFMDQEKLDRIRPHLLHVIPSSYHDKLDEVYWDYLCSNVVTGPMGGMEILACLLCRYDFSEDISPQKLCKDLYEVNLGFQGDLYQGLGKYRSISSLQTILDKTPINTWTEREIERLRTAHKTLQWARTTFLQNPSLLQNHLRPQTFEHLQRISVEHLQSLKKLFPNKTVESLEMEFLVLLLEEEEALPFPPETDLSPVEKQARIVHDYLQFLPQELHPRNPFTDGHKLDILSAYVPTLSSDVYWNFLSPCRQVGVLNAKEVLLLLLNPQIFTSDNRDSFGISKYLYEFGEKIGGCYELPDGYRSFLSIEQLFRRQNAGWEENEIQLLSNCIEAFKLGRTHAEQIIENMPSEFRGKIWSLFMMSHNQIQEIQFLFPGKKYQTILDKYHELMMRPRL